LAPLAAAQANRSAIYKIDFTIRDTGDAGAKSGRKYSMLITEHQKSVFRVGNRVPTATSTQGLSSQFTYIDVGVNIDCVIEERDSKVAIHADLDLSNAVNPNAAPNPTISQIKLVIDTTLVPGKPSVVASFDDPVTSRKFEVEATATKM
jgi:hypothetical protein